jgi:capsular exopolysaccharide synthesis family protein
MSKIHDALKKAQQERSLGAAASNQRGPNELDESAMLHCDLAATVAGGHHSTADSGRDENWEEFLRFEHLLKHCAKPTWSLDQNEVVFGGPDSGLSGAEQFRTLRSRLYRIRETLPLKKVLVTSAVVGEGKTFVATNLAQAFAHQRDRRVLLIDGDMRSPRLHLPLGAPLSPGLFEYLRGEANEMAVIQHGEEGNLCFVAGGNGVINPSELLSNKRLEILLDRVAPVFDWIILDSPPCLPVADASVLADHCDGVVLVVRAGSTPGEIAQRARQELKERNIVGVVLNAVSGADAYGGYYGYGDSKDAGK